MRVFLLLLTLILPFDLVFAESNEKLINAYLGIVMIRGYHSNGGLAYGSGVVVADNKVLTNCHIFRATKEPWVSRGEDTYPITSVKADVWHDLCLVTTYSMPFKPVPIGSSKTLQRGQEIIAVGHSNGTPAPMTSTGTVEALFDDASGNVIRTSAPFTMGASGSGLFDSDGNLVGINTFKTAGHVGSIYFALPIEWLHSLEKQENTTFPVLGKALWEEDEDKKPFYMQTAVPESREDWPKLAEIAEKWTKSEAGSSDAWYEVGFAQEHLGKPDLAMQAYQKAIDLDKHNVASILRLGQLAKTNGDNATLLQSQQAIAPIDKALGTHYGDMLSCRSSC